MMGFHELLFVRSHAGAIALRILHGRHMLAEGCPGSLGRKKLVLEQTRGPVMCMDPFEVCGWNVCLRKCVRWLLG